MYHVHTKRNPRTELLFVSALSRWRNGVSDELEANTEVHRALPFAPKYQTCHGMSRRARERLACISNAFHIDIDNIQHTQNIQTSIHPLDISSTPRKRINSLSTIFAFLEVLPSLVDMIHGLTLDVVAT